MPEGFMTLKKPVLEALAEEFGVDYNASWPKAKLIEALEEWGVNWDYYQEFVVKPKEQQEEVAAQSAQPRPAQQEPQEPVGERILLKMNRQNPSFEVRGAKFTREKPFAFVNEEDAEWIVENLEGFSMATPKQAREFYSQT